MPDTLCLSMCSGCTRQYALQGDPAGCEMQGDNGFTCPDCQAAEPPIVIIPRVKSYRLRDGWPEGARWVVLAPPVDGSCLIRRLGFPDDPPLRVPVTELRGGGHG